MVFSRAKIKYLVKKMFYERGDVATLLVYCLED